MQRIRTPASAHQSPQLVLQVFKAWNQIVIDTEATAVVERQAKGLSAVEEKRLHKTPNQAMRRQVSGQGPSRYCSFTIPHPPYQTNSTYFFAVPPLGDLAPWPIAGGPGLWKAADALRSLLTDLCMQVRAHAHTSADQTVVVRDIKKGCCLAKDSSNGVAKNAVFHNPRRERYRKRSMKGKSWFALASSLFRRTLTNTHMYIPFYVYTYTLSYIYMGARENRGHVTGPPPTAVTYPVT